MDELSKLTNGVVFVFGCFCIGIYHILASFGQIFASFTPAIGSMTTFVLGTQICFLCETQKYGGKLNNTWMITFYIGILAIFGNFWANICLVHFTCCLSCCIFARNHCGKIFSFMITQKHCANSEIWWKFLPKTNKNSQIWGKFGTSRQILDKLSAQQIIMLIY